MFRQFNSNLTAVFRHATGNLSHMVIVAMSAGIALLLPLGARQFLSFWSRVEQNPMSLVAVEMTIAVLCIAAFTYLHRSRLDRMLAETALGAGGSVFSAAWYRRPPAHSNLERRAGQRSFSDGHRIQRSRHAGRPGRGFVVHTRYLPGGQDPPGKSL